MSNGKQKTVTGKMPVGQQTENSYRQNACRTTNRKRLQVKCLSDMERDVTQVLDIHTKSYYNKYAWNKKSYFDAPPILCLKDSGSR